MGAPFVTIIWINYNTKDIMEIAIKALETLTRLDLINYEIIVVENGSTDGSDKIIEGYLRGLDREISSKIKYIKLSKNYGFTGAIHYAYKARNPAAKYCMLVNTDMIIDTRAVKEAINFLESNEHIGAVQGIILQLDARDGKVDSAGMMVDEFLNRIKLFRGQEASLILKERNWPQWVSFVEGAGPIYKVEAVEKCYQRNDVLFIPHAFIWYLEDMYLGLRMWSMGYASALLPIIFGRHYREYAVKRVREEMRNIALRNDVAINLLCKNRTYPFRTLRIFLMLLKLALLGRTNKVKAILLGAVLSLKIKRLFGYIDLSNVPQIESAPIMWKGLKHVFSVIVKK
jgi:GT2 family glycosyltransferase